MGRRPDRAWELGPRRLGEVGVMPDVRRGKGEEQRERERERERERRRFLYECRAQLGA